METVEREIPLFPLEQVVLFPGMLLPLHIFEERYKMMIGTCQVTDGVFGVTLIRAGREVGSPAIPVEVGCTARIVEIDRLPDGRMNIVATGENRFRLLAPPTVSAEGYLQGQALITTLEATGGATAGLVERVAGELKAYLRGIAKLAGKDVTPMLDAISEDVVGLSFQVGTALRVQPRERQQLLEIDDTAVRLEAGATLLRREIKTLQLMLSAKGLDRSVGPFSLN